MMLVLVTGASGYVGCHTVASIVAEGHSVRAFVRSPDKFDRAMAPLGVTADLIDVVVGDVTDAEAVTSAVDGVDAVVHTAAVFELAARFHDTVRATNETAAKLVLQAALDAGADPVVHVSSAVAILPTSRRDAIAPDNELTSGRIPGAYIASKTAAERMARELQDKGEPVIITYPGIVMGPHDPSFGHNAWVLRQYLRGLLPAVPAVDAAITDVRQLGTLHAALLQPDPHSRRYLAVADSAPFVDLLRATSRTANRHLPVTGLPPGLVQRLLAPMDSLNKKLPGRGTGFDSELGWLMNRLGPWRDEKTRDEFGLTPIPAETSLLDTARWMAESGHLTARQAGTLHP